jgi:hypothetical protein
MKLITGLPLSTNRVAKLADAILIIINCYMKMAKYFPVQKTLDISQLAQILVTWIVKDFGMPKFIMSNRDSIFTSTF